MIRLLKLSAIYIVFALMIICLSFFLVVKNGEELRRRLYSELMSIEGSEIINEYVLYKNEWPRKGADIYNTGLCASCKGIDFNQETGNKYYTRWALQKGTIPSGIRSITLGIDSYNQMRESIPNDVGSLLGYIRHNYNRDAQGANALFVTSKAGVVYKVHKYTGKILWQFDTKGEIGFGGAASVISNEVNNANRNSYTENAESYGAIMVGNRAGKLYTLSAQGVIKDCLDYSSSKLGFADSQVTASTIAGRTRSSPADFYGGWLIATQPLTGASSYSLVKMRDYRRDTWEYTDTNCRVLTNTNYYSWKFTVHGTNNGYGFATTPTIDPKGAIYIGSDKIYAIDYLGRLRWSFDPLDPLFSIVNTAIIYSAAALYVGGMNGQFYALKTTPSVKITKGTWTSGSTTMTVASADGIKPGALVVSSSSIVTQPLEFNRDYELYTTVVSVAGLVVTLSRPTTGAGTTQVVTFTSPVLWWEYSAGGQFSAYGAISPSGTIYAPNTNGYLYAFSSIGSLVWKKMFSGCNMMAPVSVAGDGSLFFSNTAISPDGEVKFTLSELTKDGNDTRASTMITVDGTVYMGTESGALYAIGSGPIPDPDTRFLEDLTSAIQEAYGGWNGKKQFYESNFNLLPNFYYDMMSDFDFTKLADGITYRRTVCSAATDRREIEILNRWNNPAGIQVKCDLDGRISYIRLQHLLRSDDDYVEYGSFGGNFFLRGLRIPSSIGGLAGLTLLDLENTNILHIPSTIGRLRKLRYLKLGSFDSDVNRQMAEGLATIPTEIGMLSKLYYLKIGNGLGGNIPSEIGRLINLYELHLPFVGRTKRGLPSTIGGLVSLTRLSLSLANYGYTSLPRADIAYKCLPNSLQEKIIAQTLRYYENEWVTTPFAPYMSPQCATPPEKSPPTPAVTTQPPTTLQPTRRPTFTPTSRSYWTMKNSAAIHSGSSVFYTSHVDQACSYAPFTTRHPAVLGKPIQLGSCSPDPINQGVYYSHTCKIGPRKYTIEQKFYSSATCTGTSIRSAVYKHESLCQWDGVRGGFLKIHCGEDDYLTAAPARVHVGVTYATTECDQNSQHHVSHWLNVCTPKYYNNILRGQSIAYNFKLLDGGPMVIGGDVTLREHRYDRSDVFCERTVVRRKDVKYPASVSGSNMAPQCQPDVLEKGRYYINSELTAPRYLIAGPTSAPTKRPTRAPSPQPTINTYSTRAPTHTARPSLAPAPIPFLLSATFNYANYSTSDSCSSTQYLTGLKICKNGAVSGWTFNSGAPRDKVYAQYRKLAPSYPDLAIMLHENLRLVSAAVTGSNDMGVLYTVEFDAAPAAGTGMTEPFKFTRHDDAVKLEVIKATGSDVGSMIPAGLYSYYPGYFASPDYKPRDSNVVVPIPGGCTSSGCVWNKASFTYTGTGSGSISLKFTCSAEYVNSPVTGAFCGAIDNVRLYKSPHQPSPSPMPTYSSKGFSSLYFMITNHWRVNMPVCGHPGTWKLAAKEIQVFNGATQIPATVEQGRYPAGRSREETVSRFGLGPQAWPGLLSDGNTDNSFLGANCYADPLGVMYMDLSNKTFDKIVFHNLFADGNHYFGGVRVALVRFPDDPLPLWQSSIPSDTLAGMSGRIFTFYTGTSKMACYQSQYCVAYERPSGPIWSYGSSTTLKTADCIVAEDCYRKYNVEWSTKKLWTGTFPV